MKQSRFVMLSALLAVAAMLASCVRSPTDSEFASRLDELESQNKALRERLVKQERTLETLRYENLELVERTEDLRQEIAWLKPDEAGAEPPEMPMSRPPASGARITAWIFLARNEPEEDGYGLYSYLIMRAAPSTEDAAARLRAAIGELRRRGTVAEHLAAGTERAKLNAAHLPIIDVLPNDIDPDDLIEQHYDYQRAAALFARIGRTADGDGPYLVSTLAPLSENANPEHYLFQNLSRCPPRLIAAWIELFEEQTSRPDFWKPDRIRQTALTMREGLAHAADAMGDVPDAASRAKSWIVAVIGLAEVD